MFIPQKMRFDSFRCHFIHFSQFSDLSWKLVKKLIKLFYRAYNYGLSLGLNSSDRSITTFYLFQNQRSKNDHRSWSFTSSHSLSNFLLKNSWFRLYFRWKNANEEIFFELLIDTAISSIIQLALERSPAYESIKDVLQNLNVDSVMKFPCSFNEMFFCWCSQKTAEEQKDLLSPILGNIIKMTIRTLSNKRTKKNNDSTSAVGFSSSKVEDENSNQEAATRPSPRLNRSAIHRVPSKQKHFSTSR